MIHVDEHGNRFFVMQDGAKAPLLDPGINIKLETAVSMADGSAMIVTTAIALAMYATSAKYWYEQHQIAQTTIADLREQLQAKG